MKPVEWFTLLAVTVVALVALDQIPLVQDLITASGFSSTEVFAGIAGILLVFYTFLAIFFVR